MKFLKTQTVATLAAVGMLAVSAMPEAHAHPSFDGHMFTIQYGLSTTGLASDFLALSSTTVEGSDAIEWVAPLGPANNRNAVRWEVDASDDTISFRFTGTGDFMFFGNPPFMGFRIVDTAGELDPIEAASVANTAYNIGQQGNLIEGFVATEDVTFDENSIYVNLYNSMYHHEPMGTMGDPTRDRIVLAVRFGDHDHGGGTPVIPEPGTWALMGLGLVGLAAARARKQG
jgi:hypothetical protein